MTKKDLMKKLEPYDDYACVCHSNEFGWANIESVESDEGMILLISGDHPESERDDIKAGYAEDLGEGTPCRSDDPDEMCNACACWKQTRANAS
jgi:hypothetical protein